MKRLKMKVPPLDCITRWNSMFMMLYVIAESKESMQSLYLYFVGKQMRDIYVEDEHWEFIDNYLEAFRPLYDLTLFLQKDTIPIGKKIDIFLMCYNFHTFLPQETLL